MSAPRFTVLHAAAFLVGVAVVSRLGRERRSAAPVLALPLVWGALNALQLLTGPRRVAEPKTADPVIVPVRRRYVPAGATIH